MPARVPITMPLTSAQTDAAMRALDGFAIELPSWGFANTGTRFGKFLQAAAATTTEEKIADAGAGAQVHRLLPDRRRARAVGFPRGHRRDARQCVKAAAASTASRIGAINPNVFQDQIYKHGSLGNPDPDVRQTALSHILDCVEIGSATGSPRPLAVVRRRHQLSRHRLTSAHRKQWFTEGLQDGPRRALRRPADAGRVQAVRAGLLLTPTSPTGAWRYVAVEALPDRGPRCWSTPATTTRRRTSSRSWRGCSTKTCSAASTSTTAATPTTTSRSARIDPYQVFRIFHEICYFAWETGKRAGHRLHGGPEPQPQGQDRGDDPDGR